MLPRSETLALRKTPLSALDPRVKFLLTVLFSLAVVAVPFDRPLFLAPLAVLLALAVGAGEVPLGYLAKRLLAGLPFVAFVIIFPLVLQRRPADLVIAGFHIHLTEGAIRAASVGGKFVLAFGAAVVLTATTGFAGICDGMSRLRFPPLFVASVALVWRYLFLLIDESARMIRGRSSRSPRRSTLALSWRSSAAIIGSLFLRALKRSERVLAAMEARGFKGSMPSSRARKLTVSDWLVLSSGTLVLAAYSLMALAVFQ